MTSTDYYPATSVAFRDVIADMVETVGYDETLAIVARALRVHNLRRLSIVLGVVVLDSRALIAGDRRRVRAAINKEMEI